MKAIKLTFVLLVFFVVGFLDAQQLVDTQIAGWKIVESKGNIKTASTAIIDTISQSFSVSLVSSNDSAYVIWGKKISLQKTPFKILFSALLEEAGPGQYTAVFFQMYIGHDSVMHPLQPGFLDSRWPSGIWSETGSNTDFYQNPPTTFDSVAIKIWTNDMYGKVDLKGIKLLYGGVNPDSNGIHIDSTIPLNIFGGTITGVTNIPRETPKSFTLSQNYPNPFNPSTVIRYQVSGMSTVSLKVYDVLGREVKTLVNEEKSAGDYTVQFNGTNLPSGTYFYRLSAGNFTETKKMILLK